MTTSVTVGRLAVSLYGSATWDGEPLGLTYHEQSLLWALAQSAGKDVSADALASEAMLPGPNTARQVRNAIHRLRKKLPNQSLIQTSRTFGYRLVA